MSKLRGYDEEKDLENDPVLLSRIQFGFTISFHILFPAFTIGLAAWLMVLEALWLRGGRAVYLQLAKFWTKLFAVSFGMGVVSGIVLAYQDRKSTRLNSSHYCASRMPSSA